MGFYQTDDTRSATLFKCLTDMAIRLGLSITDCRGQCYDGAANMSGHVSGLQSLVREQEQRALFVHCRAHSINLVAQDSVDNNPEILNTMALVQKLVAFARGSPKRLASFTQFQTDGTSLRPFCPTRWIFRKSSIISITSNYVAIMAWLHTISSDPDSRKRMQQKLQVFWRL